MAEAVPIAAEAAVVAEATVVAEAAVEAEAAEVAAEAVEVPLADKKQLSLQDKKEHAHTRVFFIIYMPAV